jgi:MFS family permease
VLPPLLGKIVTDLNSSFSAVGVIMTFSFLIYGSGALIGGPLSDRIGSLKVARLSTGLGGLMTVVFLFTNNIWFFGSAMFLMALWASFYHPTVNGLIAKIFKENTGSAMGTHNAAGNLGQVLTPTIAFMLGITFNWRLSFVFFGALSVATSFFLDRIDVKEDISSSFKPSYREFLKVPGLWMILLYNILVGYLFRSIDLFFPSFLSVDKSYAGELAALANSMILFFGIFGQIIGGKGSDKFGSANVLPVMSLGMLLSFVLLLVVPITGIEVFLFVILYGISMFGHQSTMTTLVSSISPRSIMGSVYGLMFFTSFGIGSLSTTVTGYFADNLSITSAFWLNTGVAVILFFVSVSLFRKFRKNSSSVS